MSEQFFQKKLAHRYMHTRCAVDIPISTYFSIIFSRHILIKSAPSIYLTARVSAVFFYTTNKSFNDYYISRIYPTNLSYLVDLSGDVKEKVFVPDGKG